MVKRYGFERVWFIKKDLIQAVTEMLDLSGRNVPTFKDNVPGKSWWNGFRSRHPDLKIKRTEPLEMSRH